MGGEEAELKRIFTIGILSLYLFGLPLHGGTYPRNDMSLWQLERYKYTTLLQTEPLCWCPYKSYLLVDRYVTIENRNNLNWICVKTDLIRMTADDVRYNKSHAIRYQGSTKQRLKRIYRYCYRTKYRPHTKFARDVFESRQGDCAGIASAFYVLCKRNHIPVRYVIGWADGECHAWNRVEIGGRYYWIDATLGLWLSRKQFKGRTVLETW